MTSNSAHELLEQLKPAVDVSRYANLATSYCEKHLGGIEGNEGIFGALVIAMAIRGTGRDIAQAIDGLDSLDEINSTLNSLDIAYELKSIEEAIGRLDATCADIAARG